MSPEGLNQRFNSQAVQLLQQLLANLLHQQFYSSSKISTLYTNHFQYICIFNYKIFKFRINSPLHIKVQVVVVKLPA